MTTYDVTIRRDTGETWLWIGILPEEADAVHKALPKPTLTEGFGAGVTTQAPHGETKIGEDT